MTYPTTDVGRTHLDAGTDSPQLARADLDDLVVKFNEIRNHISTFMRTVIDDADAATARATLGALAASAVSAYALTLLDDADAASARGTLGLTIGTHVPSPAGAGASGTWPINISGTAANGGVTSVNGMTGAVSVTSPVTSVNGQTGAVSPMSVDAIGSYEALANAAINSALVVGTLYAGSGLRRGMPQPSADPFAPITTGGGSGSAVPGTWRCISGAAGQTSTHNVAMFVRVS